MINIKLGFLLGLPLTPPPAPIKERLSKGPKKGKKAKSKSKATKSKTSKASKKSKTTKPPKEKPLLPEYAFEVGKPKGFFHIEYTLFPNMETCHIDLLHWEVISKIYFESKTVIYRNMIRDNTIWIPIMLEHKIADILTKEELVGLTSTVVEFLMTPNKKKMSVEAKNEKAKMFFIKKEDIMNECYVEAFEHDPNLEDNLKAQSSYFPRRSSRRSSNRHIFSIISGFDYTLLHPRFQKILNKLKKGEQITCKQYIPPPPKPLPEANDIEPNEDDVNNYTWPKSKKRAGKNKTKKSNSSKSSKKSRKTSKSKQKTVKLKKDAKIKVSGESYFTDAGLCTYRLNEMVDKINDLFIVFSTENLTSPDMLKSMEPLVIKLKSLRNLPINFLLEQKFSSVFLQYNMANIARHITQPINLKELNETKKIKINESHIFFDISPPELSFFLYYNRLFVELIGVYDKESDLSPLVYGSLKSDFVKIPARPQDVIFPKPKSMLLAVACYDLSLLMRSRKELQLTEPFRHPTNMTAQKITALYQNLKFSRPLTVEQIHLNFKKEHYQSPLLDSILFDEETALKVEVCLGYSLENFAIFGENVKKYKQLLLVVYDTSVALNLLANMMSYNQKFHNGVLIPNYFMYQEKLENIDKVDPSGLLLTGFWIDNGSSVIIFMEGSRENYWLEIVIEQIKDMNESLCRSYYNSGTYCYKRIYENFLAFGGFFKITLKYNLQSIFKIVCTHIRSCIPKPAFEAIKKLQYLLEMQTFGIISRHAVLPTANELLSFSMEFGVPHENEKMY